MNGDLKLYEITEAALGKKITQDSAKALDAYDEYKKTLSILDRVNIAMGRKSKIVSTSASSLNSTLKLYANNTTN